MADEQDFEDEIEVMMRIEATAGDKRGKMMVRGTILIDGDTIVRTSLDGTTTQALIRDMSVLKDLCNNIIREQIVWDKINTLRVDYKQDAGTSQIMMAVEGDFKAIVVQDYAVRDLRVRPNEPKEVADYKHVQNNPFFPSLPDKSP